MGGTYCWEGDYLIPNLVLPDAGDYQIGKYGRMRRDYLKEHRRILYTNYVLDGTLWGHLAEIDQSCNERMKIIVSAMSEQEGVTEALKAADQMEWGAGRQWRPLPQAEAPTEQEGETALKTTSTTVQRKSS